MWKQEHFLWRSSEITDHSRFRKVVGEKKTAQEATEKRKDLTGLERPLCSEEHWLPLQIGSQHPHSG